MARKAETRFTAKDETRAAFASFGANVENFSIRSIVKFTGIQQIIQRLANEIEQLPARARAAFNEAVTDLDRLAKSARNLGESATDLDAWEFSAGLAGVQATEFSVAARTLLRNIGDASKGIGEGRIALQQLGIQVKDNEGATKGLNQILFELNDRLQDVHSQSQRTAIAQRLMGESGGKLLELIGQQPQAFRSAFVEGRRLAESYASQADEAEKYQDQVLRMNRELRTVKAAALEFALPALTRLARFMEERASGAVKKFRQEFQDFIATFDLDTSLGDAIGTLEEQIRKYERALDLTTRAQRAQLSGSATARAEYALAQQALAELGLTASQVNDAQAELARLQELLTERTRKQKAATDEQRAAAAALHAELRRVEEAMRDAFDRELEKSGESARLFYEAFKQNTEANKVQAVEAVSAISSSYATLARHAEDFAVRAGNSFALLVTRGATAAQLLKALFLDAIRAILAELAALATFKLLLNIPGLGQAIQIGQAIGGGGGGEIPQKGGPTIVGGGTQSNKSGGASLELLSVVPITTMDQLRAARSFARVRSSGKLYLQGAG